MDGMTGEETREVKRSLLVGLEGAPPTIGVVGVSGAGKSSTINALFGTNLEISHTGACTGKIEEIGMRLVTREDDAQHGQVTLVIVDTPGLGGDIRMDSAYIDQCRERLPDCDAILWVMAARSWAAHLDLRYLEEFVEHRDRMVFGINQVDIVHPMDWNEKINLPSVKMECNIEDVVHDRAESLRDALGVSPRILGFSAEKRFNLERLFDMLISAIPDDRKSMFDTLKRFSYRDFTPIRSGGVPGHLSCERASRD